MKIAFPCPESVRLALTTDEANNHPAAGIKTTIDGGLISFDVAGETLEEKINSIRELDELVGLAIADEDRPEMIRALSDLKALYGQLIATVTRESSYIDARRNAAAEATEAAAISHLQGEQHTSINDSSEQHGADKPTNEELKNDETDEEEQVAEQPARSRKRRG